MRITKWIIVASLCLLASCATLTKPFRTWTWTEAVQYSTTPARARYALFMHKPNIFNSLLYYRPYRFSSARYGFMLSKLLIEAEIEHELLKVENPRQQISVVAPYGTLPDGRLWVANIKGVFVAKDLDDARQKIARLHF